MQLPLLPPGPLTAAAAPLATEEPLRPDPAAFLASLIDLRGGVTLSDALDGLDAVVAPPGDAPPASAVRAQLRDGVGDIQRRLDDGFKHAFRPRYRLPDAQRTLRLLGEAGALVERGGRPLKVATRTLWAPYHSFVDTQLKRARFALRDLRAALAPALARQSDDAARLVHLDGVLLEAIHPKVEALMRRVPHALERAFAAHLAAAVAALPDPPTAEDVAPWFTAAGWIPPWFAQGEVLCRAVVDHERLRLASLVEACLSAGVGDGAPSS
ncbi:MAG: DUF3348 family protein [Myxococcales bacterium]|nr:DUF3348 family protein [Myxococcales bacterium]